MILGFVGLVLAIAAVIVFKVLSKKYKLVGRLYNALSRIIFFNFILRFMIEGYLQFIINSLLNAQTMSFKTSSDAVSSGFALALLSVGCILPIFMVAFLFKFQKKLGQQNFASRTNSLYFGLRIESKLALMFNVIFVLRRLVFALTCVMCSFIPVAQIQALIFQCILNCIYLGIVKPFYDPISNKMEIFNEITIMCCGYHLFLLTDFMPDSAKQYTVGYSLIVITTLNIAVNFGVIIVLGVKKIILKFKAFRKNWPTIKQKLIAKIEQLKAKRRQKKYALNETEKSKRDTIRQLNLAQTMEKEEHDSVSSPVNGQRRQKRESNDDSKSGEFNITQFKQNLFDEGEEKNQVTQAYSPDNSRKKFIIDELNENFRRQIQGFSLNPGGQNDKKKQKYRNEEAQKREEEEYNENQGEEINLRLEQIEEDGKQEKPDIYSLLQRRMNNFQMTQKGQPNPVNQPAQVSIHKLMEKVTTKNKKASVHAKLKFGDSLFH